MPEEAANRGGGSPLPDHPCSISRSGGSECAMCRISSMVGAEEYLLMFEPCLTRTSPECFSTLLAWARLCLSGPLATAVLLASLSPLMDGGDGSTSDQP